jgi:hypothetical protein
VAAEATLSLSVCRTGADSFSRGQSCPIFGATRGSDRESVAHFDRPLENDFEHFLVVGTENRE